jgi:multidrug resistance efflux pump
MSLRIRKEVQARLKASLEGGAPEAASSRPAEADQAVARGDSHGEAASGKSGLPAALSRPALRRPGLRSDIAWRHALRKERRGAMTGEMTGLPPEAAAEIAAIRSLFDALIAASDEPARLRALRSLTERYLEAEPSRQRIDQVRSLLERQAAHMRRERERRPAAHRPPMIEAVAVATPEAETQPAPTTAPTPSPEPDRLRRGEPAADPATAAPARRRRGFRAWLRRSQGGKGGGKGGDGGGKGGPVDPSVQRHPIRARVKTALMATVWAAAGVGVVGYAASLVYVNYLRLEIDSALISGSVEPVNAPFDGSVTTLLVKAGDRLVEGMRYMILEDPEVEKQVKLFAIRVDRAREELRLKQAELEAEKAKRDEYVNISKNKLEKINSDIAAYERQEAVARERFERLSDLFKKGFVTRPRLEDASDKLAEVTTLLAKARISRRERDSQFEGVLAGHFFDGNQVVGRLREAEAAVARASAEVDLAIEELQALQQRRQVNKIAAPHDARVLKILRQEGAAVKRGDTILVVERLDERVVHAFLRQEEASRVAIGDEAVVFVPALRARATAKVTGVERNAAFLDDVDARYSWKTARDGGPKPTDKDRTARITLKFEGADKAVVEGKFEIGMPTVVSFPRRSVNTVFSDFADVARRL